MQTKLYWIGNIGKGRLAILPRPRGGDWLEDEIHLLQSSGVEVLVSLLTSDESRELDLLNEPACCAGGGIEFLSFPVPDRSVPSLLSKAAAFVRQLATRLAGGKAVAIHCRQGVGRSALLAACVLTGFGERPDAAFERIARARGCAVPDTAEQRDWVRSFTERHAKQHDRTMLLLSTWTLPAAPALARAARAAGWSVRALDENPLPSTGGRKVYYGGSDVARQVAASFGLVLLEPPLDLLARLPASLRLRDIEFARFRDLCRLRRPTFIKPADPLDRCFDAGIYSDSRDIRTPRGIDPETPILVAEPVEWLAEFRCFVREGGVVATSPYLSFGKPVWKAWGQGGEKAVPSMDATVVCWRLLEAKSLALPPAFVVDVGLIEGQGWAVVEFNPAWCSGLLGADPAAVLSVLARASRDANGLDPVDSAWIVSRERANAKP